MTDQPRTLIVYGHATCPQVPPLRAILRQAGVPYDYVDIRADEAARERVRAINHGNESVPTLEFPDGSTLTEPTPGQLQRKLKTLGYRLPLTALILGNWPWIVLGLGLLWALLALLGVL